MKKDFYFNNNCFVIENFDQKQPFSSFLPGIAGLYGIPLWAFYVNRGQGIASFGIRDKNGALMEYYPADASYFLVERIGFRTFLKIDGVVHELFCYHNENAVRRMEIEPHCFRIAEERQDLKIRIKITYFNLPNEPFGALARKVELEDFSGLERNIEILDGLPKILPAGLSYDASKAVSNLMRSWIEVRNLEHKIPYYKMRATTADSPDVKRLYDGNFYLSVFEGNLIRPLIDGDLVFKYDTSFSKPLGFVEKNLSDLLSETEYPTNKYPTAFTPLFWDTGRKRKIEFFSLAGYAEKVEVINRKAEELLREGYIEAKEEEAKGIVSSLTDLVATKTAFPLFDKYISQNYLDNILRGGHPIVIGDVIYHVFSRKHGDLERDYNFFVTAPEYYSQGNGNFRDVCQNRRNDVLIENRVKDHNLYLFGNLIQADGYNPLAVNGTTFKLKKPLTQKVSEIIKAYPELETVLKNKFTPGNILVSLEGKATRSEQEELLSEILSDSELILEAEYGEGYWQDHWTYILDLLETFLKVYPDFLYQALIGRKDYRFFNSPVTVQPRSEKYVRTFDGKIRQFGAIVYDREKVQTCKMTPGSNWLKNDAGEIVETNLYSKLLVLAANKFACLDPSGIGISYEADKPGWNDAMNGLPGLFGSGVSETIELFRLVAFLFEKGKEYQEDVLYLPEEFSEFLKELETAQSITGKFDYWDQTTTLLENYREKIRFYTQGLVEVEIGDVLSLLAKMKEKLHEALTFALKLGKGIYPTYLIHDAETYEVIYENGKEKKNRSGLTNVRVTAFRAQPLPYFLEAPARALRTPIPGLNKHEMHQRILGTGLYDQKFRFFKTSESLDDIGLEVGRIAAFTKGWFERESNFLHMTYKYLFGLLEAGLYEEFFEAAKTNLVCFMNPEIYGRSTLENSSFIVPANNPDPKIWGKGFVSRLSGSTAEMLSIWQILFFGRQLFRIESGKLCFVLEPILKGEFFGAEGVVQTTLFGKTKIVYYNPRHLDTYKNYIVKMELDDGQDVHVVFGNKLDSDLVLKIRNREFKTIKVYYK